MADTKISALPASTTPLAGTEVLPIVQNGATKQVSVANLTAGRAISATELTLSTGNLVIGTSGKGIDFSANPNPAGMTSEILNDYEEGTWTPSTTFAAFVGAASSEGTYTKIGRMVVVRGSLTGGTSVTVGATGILTGDLPFSVASNAIGTMAASTNTASGNIRATGSFLVATTTIAPVTSITFTATYFV